MHIETPHPFWNVDLDAEGKIQVVPASYTFCVTENLQLQKFVLVGRRLQSRLQPHLQDQVLVNYFNNEQGTYLR